MKRRNTVLSVLIMGSVAWVLIAPVDIDKTEPKKNAPSDLEKTQMPPPQQVITMTTITLPPPPQNPTHVSPSHTPMTAAKINPMKASTPVTPKSTSAQSPRKVIELKPLTPRPAPLQTINAPAVKPVPALQKASSKSAEPKSKPLQKTSVLDTSRAPLAAKQSAADGKKTGRPLLKLLEFGKGPSIEISWPDDTSTRARLYSVFNQCYGMQVAFMRDDGALFDDTSSVGQSWAFNNDKFSGFVRQSQGRAARSEEAKIQAIRSRHDLRSGTAVRLFPRDTDALLLAGLHQLIGRDYSNNKTIHARYQISGRRVQVVDIYSNGLPIKGSVDLSGAAKSNCLI